MDKRFLVHPYKRYYSAIRRKKQKIHGLIYRNIKDIMLSKRSQPRKATYCIVPFI